MNFISLTKKSALGIALLTFSLGHAQNTNTTTTTSSNSLDPSVLLKAGVEDGQKLVQAYMTPFFRGFGAGLNNGWYNTARPHRPLRFDLTVNASLIFIPTADQSYDISSLGLKALRLTNPSAGSVAPTAFGTQSPGPEVGVYVKDPRPGVNKDTAIAKFNTPQGIGIAMLPVPTAQLAIGIYKNTELMIRYMPTLEVPDVAKIGLWGVGVKHDIKQWIPAWKDKNFELSGMFGYTHFSTELSLNLQPDADAEVKSTNGPYAGQKLSTDIGAWTFNVLASKKFSIITLYAGLGYQASTSTVALTGIYPVSTVDANTTVNGAPNPDFGKKIVQDFKDPFNIKITDGSPRLNAGFRLKLAILTLHFDYTLANYSALTAGVGLNIDFSDRKKAVEAERQKQQSK